MKLFILYCFSFSFDLELSITTQNINSEQKTDTFHTGEKKYTPVKFSYSLVSVNWPSNLITDHISAAGLDQVQLHCAC